MIARITLDAHRISLDPALQPRTHTSETLVQEYTDEMKAGATFPPVVVYEVAEDYLCADGWHRVLAARAAGLEVAAEIRQGTFEDALVCALGANETHGARRTRADKRRAVEIALRDDGLGKRSDREIARICAVSHPFVGVVRAELFPTSVEPGGGNVSTPEPVPEPGLPPQPALDAAGEVEASASLPPSGPSQQEEEERLVREKILQAALGCLSHSFHGEAPVRAFRLGVALLFGAELIDEEWDRVVSTGAARGLWTIDGDTIRSHAARPRTVPPVDSPIPTRAPISTSGDPPVEEDDEPAPVAPLKPSKPRPSALPERLDRSLVDLRCESCEEMLERLFLSVQFAALVIADPPWSYRRSHGTSRADDHYHTLSTEQIASHLDQASQVGWRLALWITGPLLGEWAEHKLRWGPVVTAGAWIKSREDDSGHYGQGYHWAGCVEHVLIYTSSGSHTDRSSPLRNGWQEAPGEHSAKPIGWQTQWIRRWVPEGGLVVDLYAGLGSVAHATLLAGGGRRYVGCDLDPARHARALESIEALCAKDGA